MKTIRTALISALALVAIACSEGGSFSSSVNTYDTFYYSDFLSEYKDSVAFSNYFTGNSGYYMYNSTYTNNVFQGGIVLSMKVDQNLDANNADYSVAGETASQQDKDNIFAVFYQNPDESKMPEHELYLLRPTTNTVVSPTGCFIANTNRVLSAIKYGTDEAEGFKEGDYLSAVFTSYDADGKKINSVSTYLARYSGSLSYITKWEELKLSGLGDFTFVDISLETNRTDLPLNWFCFDSVSTHLEIEG